MSKYDIKSISGGAQSSEINDYIKSIKNDNADIILYQEITARYFTSKFMDKSDMLLLYWDMGSGKTIGSLLCAIRALESNNYKQIVVLSPKSIQDVFLGNLKKLCRIIGKNALRGNYLYRYYYDRIQLIPYNAWNANEQLKSLGNLEDTIFIIDEVHLFIKSVIKVNVTQKDMKSPNKKNVGNAKRIYDMIRNLKNKKILCLTGTPLAKFSFEMVPLFNLSYRDKDLFTENYNTFQSKYYDSDKEELRKDKYQQLLKKIDGKVSYVPPVDAGVKVSKLKEVLVEMSVGQFKQYVYDYCLELEENGYTSSVNIFGMPFGSISSYHTKTFQDCLYWNSELDISNFDEVVFKNERVLKEMSGGVAEEKEESFDEYEPPYSHIHKYPQNFEEYFDNMEAKKVIGGANDEEDDDSGSEIRHNIKKFVIDKNHCPKLIKMYEDSTKYEGIKCFYFRLTRTYGCDTMEKVLQKYGYSLANPDKVFDSEGKHYVVFTGKISQETRNNYMRMINDKRNSMGNYIQYIIISPSGQVGISLHNVRFLGIGTTEFNYAAIRQIQTRCVRYKSHDDLPPNKRTLEQRIYFASPNKSYLASHIKNLSIILSRTDPWIKNEKHPSIERIIYYNSMHDDIPMQAFRKLLYKASITEKLFKYSSD